MSESCHVCGKEITTEQLENRKKYDIWSSQKIIEGGREITVTHCSFDCCEKFVLARSICSSEIKANNPVFLARVKAKREGRLNEKDLFLL